MSSPTPLCAMPIIHCWQRESGRKILSLAPSYAAGLPQLLSLECWGGATFDVAMRFLSEDPWERLALIRTRAPNILTQMLLRGANAIGYTNYPDNVARHFVDQAAKAGMDLFRIFFAIDWRCAGDPSSNLARSRTLPRLPQRNPAGAGPRRLSSARDVRHRPVPAPSGRRRRS